MYKWEAARCSVFFFGFFKGPWSQTDLYFRPWFALYCRKSFNLCEFQFPSPKWASNNLLHWVRRTNWDNECENAYHVYLTCTLYSIIFTSFLHMLLRCNLLTPSCINILFKIDFKVLQTGDRGLLLCHFVIVSTVFLPK